ncbi:nuclear pore complex protein NUP54 [Euphorbia lathyris]|uniref:nuclear pore complex protein NUP54 n=1 Tax=Euphorbia lathyris TaxID=212925 RepID=UPI003313CFE8
MFGAQTSSPAFGAPSSTPAFGSSVFGASSSTPAFGSSAFATPSPAFGTPSSTPAFGTPSTSSFATGFGSSLFSTPFSAQTQQQQQQQQTPFFQQPSTGFGFQTPFSTPQTTFPNAQLTTQMAPVAPLPTSLADREIQAIVDAYKEDPGNPKYLFKYMLFSVIDPPNRVKPAGVSDSDIMWLEAMTKLQGMESSDRERLWPQLVQGFKDLSVRLKLQDEVILSDADRLRMTQSNVKMLQRHFQGETLPWIQRLRQKEQCLQRRLLRVMRIIEALEGKGYRMPLMKGEAELAEKLAAISRQLKGPGAELSRKVQNLLSVSRVQVGAGGSICLPGSTKIHEKSLADMQEVLQQQTEAIARVGNVLKRDMRDMKIIMREPEDTEMAEDAI